MPTEPTEAPPSLLASLAAHAIELPAEQVEQLDRYCRLLWDWNEKINLTRHTNFEKFVTRDVVDSLQLAATLAPNEHILDVGTGGGVPGVVLAIIRPDLKVSLAESVGKKAKVVGQIVADLGLSVPVHTGRAEELLAQQRFDSLVMRAVAPLSKLLTWFSPFWDRFGRLLVIKGPGWVEERDEARQRNLFGGLQLRKVTTWPLPGTASESVLLEIRPKQD